MSVPIFDDLVQSTRMGTGFARDYAAYGLWMLRRSPEHMKGYVEADDICVHYHCFRRGEPVLLLHGGFMCAETWVGQIPALACRYRVIATDSRGHGRTTLGTGPITYRRMATDTAALIAKLKLDAVHLVGWSDGGCTGLAMAIEYPDLVRSVTLLGTPFHTDNYSEEAKRKLERTLKPGSPTLLSLSALRRMLTPEPERGREFVEKMRKLWLELPDFTHDELGGITAPVLVIGCDRDEYLSLTPDPLQVFKDTAAAIPGSRLEVVTGGTHSVHIERPRDVNRLILDFLRGIG
jgi:pimeloyl-ACP methyl ester carboxylesterase